jgi:hypothetical protein
VVRVRRPKDGPHHVHEPARDAAVKASNRGYDRFDFADEVACDVR